MQAIADPPVVPSDESMDPDAGADAPLAPRTTVPPTAPRWGVELPVVASVLGAVAAVVYRVWDRSWSTPFVHAGDAMAHLALLETVGWTGTPAPNDRLGAPYSVDWVDMPSGADRAHLIVLRGLRAVTGDSVTAANIYLLLAIVMVGLAAYVVMRRLSCSPLASGVASVVFAVAPAQFARASVGHLFLANYVAVPIAVYLALWATGGLGPYRRGWRAWVVPGRAGGGRRLGESLLRRVRPDRHRRGGCRRGGAAPLLACGAAPDGGVGRHHGGGRRERRR